MSKKSRHERELEQLRERLQKGVPDMRSLLAVQRYADRCQRLAELEARVALEHTIADFTAHASTMRWRDAADFERSLRSLWRHQMEDLYQLYTLPDDATCCTADCEPDGCTIQLNEQLQIYGCTRHGTLHQCLTRHERDPQTGRVLQRDPRCDCTLRRPNDDVVCIFSGRVVRKHLSQTGTTRADFRSDSDSKRRQARYAYAVAASGGPERFHNDAVAGDVRVTEIQQSTATTTRPRGRKRKRFVPNGYREQCLQREVMHERKRYMLGLIGNVMNRLLHDEQWRHELNKYMEHRAEEAAKKALREHMYQRLMQQRMYSLTECISEFWHPMLHLVKFPLIEPDHHAQRRFALHTMRLWEACHASPLMKRVRDGTPAPHDPSLDPCTLHQFALAILFAQRDGFFVGGGSELNQRRTFMRRGMMFVRQQPHLHLELPSLQQIDMFSNSSRDQVRAFNEARGGQVGVSEAADSGALVALTAGDESLPLHQRSKRRRQQRHPNRQIDVGGSRKVSEASMLPDHWQPAALGTEGQYRTADVTRGEKFLRACLQSYSADSLRELHRSLFG